MSSLQKEEEGGGEEEGEEGEGRRNEENICSVETSLYSSRRCWSRTHDGLCSGDAWNTNNTSGRDSPVTAILTSRPWPVE